MDIVQFVAAEYKKLTTMQYKITFSNNKSILVRFRVGNFAHLSGLDKFTDLHEIASCYNPSQIYKKALTGKISKYSLQSSSHYCTELVERLTFIPQIKDLLSDGLAVWGFDCKKAGISSRLKSSILFFNENDQRFFLTLGVAQGEDCYYPETFFNNFNGIYTNGQEIVKISCVELISCKV